MFGRSRGTRMHFADRLVAAVRRAGNAVLVGIDPQVDRLPQALQSEPVTSRVDVARILWSFAREVVDVVAHVVPAVKFQAAYYEAYGPEGMVALHESARYARERGLIVLI